MNDINYVTNGYKGIKWHKRFLSLAEHISTWSKDPSTKIGAVIVDENRLIVGTGYNGFPRGVLDTPERYKDRDTKLRYVVHAESNACINSTVDLRRLKWATIYVWPTLMIPSSCPECCKDIIQNGIKEIVMYHTDHVAERWQQYAEASRTMLTEAGVKITVIK